MAPSLIMRLNADEVRNFFLCLSSIVLNFFLSFFFISQTNEKKGDVAEFPLVTSFGDTLLRAPTCARVYG